MSDETIHLARKLNIIIINIHNMLTNEIGII